MSEELGEETLVVQQVYRAHSFTDRVHSQASCTHIDGLYASLGCNQRSDSRATQRVLSNDELLDRHTCTMSKHLEDALSHAVSCVALIRINLQNDAFVEQWRVLRLVLSLVIGVNGVRHVCRANDRSTDSSEVILLGFGTEALRNTLSDLLDQV